MTLIANKCLVTAFRPCQVLVIGLMLLLLDLGAAAQERTTGSRIETGFLDRVISHRGDQFRYQVYVPAEYGRAKSWPIILYLHANGGQGADGTRQTNQRFADALRQDRSRFQAVIVFAQAKELPGQRL